MAHLAFLACFGGTGNAGILAFSRFFFTYAFNTCKYSLHVVSCPTLSKFGPLPANISQKNAQKPPKMAHLAFLACFGGTVNAGIWLKCLKNHNNHPYDPQDTRKPLPPHTLYTKVP